MMPRYVPEDSLQSPRFTGPATFARLPLVSDLTDVDVAIVGVLSTRASRTASAAASVPMRSARRR